MTRSIFDPTGGQTERSGSAFLGPDAAQVSHMPEDVIDGVVAPDEIDMAPDADTQSDNVEAAANEPADALKQLNPDEASLAASPDDLCNPGTERRRPA